MFYLDGDHPDSPVVAPALFVMVYRYKRRIMLARESAEEARSPRWSRIDVVARVVKALAVER